MEASTKACRFCAEQIQQAAIVCKHCGRDQRPKPKSRAANTAMSVLALGVFAIIVCGVGCVVCVAGLSRL